MEDASLDDFLGGDAATSDGDDAAAEGVAADDVDGADQADGEDETEIAEDPSTPVESTTDVAAVEPARSTLSFSPDGGECPRCGAAVGRRWTDGDALVCRECKEW